MNKTYALEDILPAPCIFCDVTVTQQERWAFRTQYGQFYVYHQDCSSHKEAASEMTLTKTYNVADLFPVTCDRCKGVVTLQERWTLQMQASQFYIYHQTCSPPKVTLGGWQVKKEAP